MCIRDSNKALDGGQLDAPGLPLKDAGQEALNLLGQTAAAVSYTHLSSLSLSIILGNTFDNAIEACCSLPAEQRTIHLQLRKQYRSLF